MDFATWSYAILPLGNIRPCPENHFPTIQVFVRSFEIRNPTCTIYAPRTALSCTRVLNLVLQYSYPRPLHVQSSCFFFFMHCILFLEQFLSAEKNVVVLQPSAAAQRYAGSTHTDSGNCWYMPAPISDHPDRPDPEPPGNRTHAGVYSPVGNFWCATMHCSSEHGSCRSGTVRSSAGH